MSSKHQNSPQSNLMLLFHSLWLKYKTTKIIEPRKPHLSSEMQFQKFGVKLPNPWITHCFWPNFPFSLNTNNLGINTKEIQNAFKNPPAISFSNNFFLSTQIKNYIERSWIKEGKEEKKDRCLLESASRPLRHWRYPWGQRRLSSRRRRQWVVWRRGRSLEIGGGAWGWGRGGRRRRRRGEGEEEGNEGLRRCGEERGWGCGWPWLLVRLPFLWLRRRYDNGNTVRWIFLWVVGYHPTPCYCGGNYLGL